MYSGEFERIGKRLFNEHLVGGNFGNISARKGTEGFFIKQTGSYLDVAGEPVFIPLKGKVPDYASSEYRVHRDVYRKTGHEAIVHAHPPYAVAASLVMDMVVPEDSEGMMLCPKIPVVEGAPGSQKIADNVSNALMFSELVIIRGHGTFAAGKNLDAAYVYTSLAEHSCKVLFFKKVYADKNTSVKTPHG
ncbi:MAG: aldolase [Methanoregula sp.]|nr:aldolase [Methanoregula sp.]